MILRVEIKHILCT